MLAKTKFLKKKILETRGSKERKQGFIFDPKHF